MPLNTNAVHILSAVSEDRTEAVCAHCGPVALKRVSGGRVRCSKAHAADRRRGNFKRKYGITLEDWTSLLVSQSGMCSICSDQLRDPCLDHDHQTGTVRGILCRDCNLGLGHFRDSVALLGEAIRYLAA